ncbi:LCP family protein [Aeromicrobium sp. CF3.5]|uniref:LCP family protein n=1 Tax=Aeromicrobium sp. CF3.5 TaxID=3373078 RepID=UPI003EE6D5BF
MTSPERKPGWRRTPRRRLRRVLMGSGVLVAILGIVAGAAVWKLQGNIDTVTLSDSTVAQKTPEGAMNVLFIGSDSRDLDTEEYGSSTTEDDQRSDALMLVHFSADNSRIDAVQIPRDTLVDLKPCAESGKGSFEGGPDTMINEALEGGPACSVSAVEQLSDVRIDHFVQLDFDGFASMVNALGGVDVCIDEPLVDADAKLDLAAGDQRLDGKDALALARSRKAIGDGSDIGRLGHQQAVMSSIIGRARSIEVLSRPDRLFSFLNAVTSSITVDEGISSIRSLAGLANRARVVPDKAITFVTMPTGAAPTDPNRVVATPDAEIIFDEMAKDQELTVTSDDPTTTPDQSSDDSKSTPVTILNGAGVSDVATPAQTALQSNDFVVAGLGTAPTSTDTTITVDGTPEAAATAKALKKKFDLSAEIVEGDIAGVQLVIGSDQAATGLETSEPPPVTATTRNATQNLCS